MKEIEEKEKMKSLEIPSISRESPVLVFILGVFGLGILALLGLIGIILISP